MWAANGQLIASAAQAVAGFGLLGFSIYAIRFTKQQLKHAEETRNEEKSAHQADMLLKFIEKFDSEPYTGLRRAFAKHWLEQGPYESHASMPAGCWRLLDFFESLSWAWERGRLDLSDVRSEFSEWIAMYESELGRPLESWRRDQKDFDYYDSFSKLAKALKADPKGMYPTQSDVRIFFQGELDSLKDS